MYRFLLGIFTPIKYIFQRILKTRDDVPRGVTLGRATGVLGGGFLGKIILYPVIALDRFIRNSLFSDNLLISRIYSNKASTFSTKVLFETSSGMPILV